MPFAALLLDMDGTLVDSEPRHFQAHRRLLAGKGVPVTEADLLGNIGKGDLVVYGSLFARHQVKADAAAWVEEKTDLLIAIYRREGLPLRPGVMALLDHARDRGIPCAVVTSAERRLARITLETTGLAARLPMRVCYEDVIAHKPDPAPYLLAAQRLGVPAQRCLAVEDSISGVRSARAAGATVVGFPGLIAAQALHDAGARCCVGDLAEVFPAVAALADGTRAAVR